MSDIDKSLCVLHVPDGCVETYCSRSTWRDFLNIVEMSDEVLTGIEETSEAQVQRVMPQSIYDLKGRRLNDLQPGLNIVHMSDGTIKKVWMK